MKDQERHLINSEEGSRIIRPRTLEARGITTEFLEALQADFEAEVEKVDPGSIERTRRAVNEYKPEKPNFSPESFQGDPGIY